MNALSRALLVILGLLLCSVAQADSAYILAKAQLANSQRFQFAQTKGAEIRNTSDNKAFTVWWQPSSAPPDGVIVSLHGHDSYATDEFYLWQPYAAQRNYAILAIQWWFGVGETTSDYYQPQEMYTLIAALLKEKGVKASTAFLHGYSRGSANSYAMTAYDASSGNHYFAVTLSNSGGAMLDFPPNQQIAAGVFGAKPFNGVQWLMYCGEKDPDPTINGCPAMTTAKAWVTQFGATMKLFIDDPNGDHGGFMLNASNVNTALDAVADVFASVAAGPQSGWWWNPAENGRGFFIEFRGANVFLASFLYDASTRATWTTSGGTTTNFNRQYSGVLDSYSGGQTLTGVFKTPTAAAGLNGNIRLNFTDSQHGTLTWAGGTIPIQRFDFGGLANPVTASQPETGWWWSPQESGRGFSIELQGNSLFMTGYMYDTNGNPIWYSSSGTLSSTTSYHGTWQQYANGQTLTGKYQTASIAITNVGSLGIQFNTTSTATLTLPDGRQIALQRFKY
ncbi:MAG: peptidase S8 and S53 subtilisin kexin sedolisin [Comamonadaceae bacterium]|nr:MAG: peptidase S8 and S53 subtilisin kexin sedolisin [Comamonadaceae bacterium]